MTVVKCRDINSVAFRAVNVATGLKRTCSKVLKITFKKHNFATEPT